MSSVTTGAQTRRILDCRHVRGEMNEQPDVLARLSRHVEHFAGQVAELAARHGGFRDVVFLSGPHSQPIALLGRHAVAVRCGLPSVPPTPPTPPSAEAESAADAGSTADSAPAPEPAAERGAADSGPLAEGLDRRLFIALSPSGDDERVLELAQRALDTGSCVVAVTNDTRSPLARLATLNVDIAAGLELSASATKSVTGMMLAVLALIDGLPDASVAGRYAADARGSRIAHPDCALSVARAVGDLLEDRAPADAAAARLVPARRVAVVGQGQHHPAALETARMLRETAGLLVEGFSVDGFCSGPMSGFDAETAVVLLAGRGHTAVRSLRARLRARGAQVVMIGGDTESDPGEEGATGDSVVAGDDAAAGEGAACADLPLPSLAGPGGSGESGGYSALGTAAECILATARGQQLAVAAARALGLDPDRPAAAEGAENSPVRPHEHAGDEGDAERGDGDGAR